MAWPLHPVYLALSDVDDEAFRSRKLMLNLLRKFLRPTLREQLESGVREALRRYADRRTAPNLRVYVSTDLIPHGIDHGLWARDESEHLRRFALQWSEDNNILRTGLRLEVILLDTKREFAFVKTRGSGKAGGERRQRRNGRARGTCRVPPGGRDSGCPGWRCPAGGREFGDSAGAIEHTG